MVAILNFLDVIFKSHSSCLTGFQPQIILNNSGRLWLKSIPAVTKWVKLLRIPSWPLQHLTKADQYLNPSAVALDDCFDPLNPLVAEKPIITCVEFQNSAMGLEGICHSADSDPNQPPQKIPGLLVAVSRIATNYLAPWTKTLPINEGRLGNEYMALGKPQCRKAIRDTVQRHRSLFILGSHMFIYRPWVCAIVGMWLCGSRTQFSADPCTTWGTNEQTNNSSQWEAA